MGIANHQHTGSHWLKFCAHSGHLFLVELRDKIGKIAHVKLNFFINVSFEYWTETLSHCKQNCGT